MDAKDIWKEFAVPFMLLILFVVAIFGVLNLTKNVAKPPVITLSSSDEIVTDQTSVPVSGTVKNTNVLTINNKAVTLNKDGNFNTNIPVNIGENSISIVAGNSTKVTQTVKVTREEVAKAIIATSTSGTGLATSGPAENLMGSIGFGAIVVSLLIYRKSKRRNPLQKAVSLV
jgi:hypothetical protein